VSIGHRHPLHAQAVWTTGTSVDEAIISPSKLKTTTDAAIVAGSFIKAFVYFDGTGTPAISDHYNVSSITDHAVGEYTVNFTTALANADYAVGGVVAGTNTGATLNRYTMNITGDGAGGETTKTTGAVRVFVVNAATGAAVDAPGVSVQITGNS
jgi:hypothetical protein